MSIREAAKQARKVAERFSLARDISIDGPSHDGPCRECIDHPDPTCKTCGGERTVPWTLGRYFEQCGLDVCFLCGKHVPCTTVDYLKGKWVGNDDGRLLCLTCLLADHHAHCGCGSTIWEELRQNPLLLFKELLEPRVPPKGPPPL